MLDELSAEFEVDILLEEREKCFSLAKKKLQGVLQRKGSLDEHQSVDVKCIRRTNKSGKKSIAKEILELF